MGISTPRRHAFGRERMRRGDSVECATESMGRLMVAYSDGLSAIEGRRRGLARYLKGLSEVSLIAESIAPGNPRIEMYYTLLEGRTDTDDGRSPLAAGRAGHALRGEMRLRGLRKFRSHPKRVEVLPPARVRGERVVSTGSLETLGMLAAEYIGLVYVSEDAAFSIYRDAAEYRVSQRRARVEGLMYRLTRELDDAHAPVDDPVNRALEFTARDIRRVEASMRGEPGEAGQAHPPSPESCIAERITGQKSNKETRAWHADLFTTVESSPTRTRGQAWRM